MKEFFFGKEKKKKKESEEFKDGRSSYSKKAREVRSYVTMGYGSWVQSQQFYIDLISSTLIGGVKLLVFAQTSDYLLHGIYQILWNLWQAHQLYATLISPAKCLDFYFAIHFKSCLEHIFFSQAPHR